MCRIVRRMGPEVEMVWFPLKSKDYADVLWLSSYTAYWNILRHYKAHKHIILSTFLNKV